MSDGSQQKRPARDADLTQYQRGSGEGLEELRKGLAAEPENLVIKEWLAFSLYTNDRIDEAIDLYVDLTAHDPDKPMFSYYLANCYAKKGRLVEAIEPWERVIWLADGEVMGSKAKALLGQARRLLAGS